MNSDDRFDEDWKAWRCADCDPALEDPAEFSKPYVILLPEAEDSPDHCPRCSSYLSFCEEARGLRITNTPAERYAKERNQ